MTEDDRAAADRTARGDEGDVREVLTRGGRAPDRVVRYGDAPEQLVDLHDAHAAHDPAMPVVVLVHGGYWKPEWDRTHMRPMADALADEGCAVAVVEYRRIPGDPDATVADAAAAVHAAIDALGGDREVVVAGFSAGGHLALWLAADETVSPRIARVVALAPVAGLADGERLALGDHAVRAFLGAPAAQRQDLDPMHRAPRTQVRIVHGEQDDVVPIELAAAYAAAHGLALTRVAGDHEDLIEPGTTAWPAVADAVLRP